MPHKSGTNGNGRLAKDRGVGDHRIVTDTTVKTSTARRTPQNGGKT